MLNPRQRIGNLIDGRYEITRLIGRGAMADVFRASDRQAGREVAVKILRHSGFQEPEAMARFIREARAQEMIEHHNVAALYGGGTTRHSEPYLVVELLRGRSLHTLLRRGGPVGLLRASTYCWQVLQGLAAMHTVGVYHRDLKPANVMIETTDDGHERVVLIDFGFAGLEGGSRLTMQGHVVGSLSYMAPERLNGRPSDERSDVYAAGILLYELLVGRPPFLADNDYQLINAHLDEAPVPPSVVAPDCGITEPVESLLLRALEKKPDDRQQSATQMAKELEQAVFMTDSE